MISLFRLIRFQNLMIIMLTQGLIFFGLFKSVFTIYGISAPVLFIDFLLLFAFTALIAAAGYIINDLVDTKPDSINKPEKLIIGKTISKNNGFIWYFIFLTLGLLVGITMDIRYLSIQYTIIHPLLSIGLALYSLKLKKMPLAGNILIAVFSAMVPAICLLFFQESLKELNQKGSGPELTMLSFIVVAYIVFALLSSLMREIVKDLEDLDGDARSGIRSTAVAMGINKSKLMAMFVSMLLGISLIICAFLAFTFGQWIIRILPLLLLLILIHISINITKSGTKADFTRLSNEIKLFMLAGLICLMILSFVQF